MNSRGVSCTNCCVIGCRNNYANTDKSIKFYSFPSRPHDQEKRLRWINAVRRNRLKNSETADLWEPKKYTRICSKHFIGDTRSNHPLDPSYIPTIFPDVCTNLKPLQNSVVIIDVEDVQPLKKDFSSLVDFGSSCDSFLFHCDYYPNSEVSTYCTITLNNPFQGLVEKNVGVQFKNEGNNSDLDVLTKKSPCELNSPERYECDQCEFETFMKVNLHNHVEVFHEGKATRFDLRRILEDYQCQNCDFQTFSLLVFLKHIAVCKTNQWLKYEHRITKNVDVDKWHKCEQCDFITKWKNSLRRHNRSMHRPNEIKWLKCDHCVFKTKWRHGLKQHLKTHDLDEIKWFKCEYCDFTTKWKHCLKVHNRTHTRNEFKRFKCDNCSYETKSNWLLRMHRGKQHCRSIRGYKCELCTFRARYPSHLKEHFNMVHAVGPEIVWYKCELCSYQAKRAKYLKVHVNSKHAY